MFILGCFLDFFEIAFIMVPLLAPVAEKLGIDLIWFGVIAWVSTCRQAFLTPPFGFALFYLRSDRPDQSAWHDETVRPDDRAWISRRRIDLHRNALPFIIIQVVMVIGILIAFPGPCDTLQGPIR